MIKITATFLLYSLCFAAHAQNVSNLKALDNFLAPNGIRMVIIGEEHTSAANVLTVFSTIKYLQANGGMDAFVMEIGPSEAYFYNQFLESGVDSLLAYTFYGSKFKEWKAFWKKLYTYNRSLPKHKRILVKGIDFDRAHTFGRLIQHMAHQYGQLPKPLNGLVKTTSEEGFYQNYTHRLPTREDIAFLQNAKTILNKCKTQLSGLITLNDFQVLEAICNNPVEGFAGKREKGLFENTIRLSQPYENARFMMLIGRGHANYQFKNLAYMLKTQSNINVLSAISLYEGSQTWSTGFKAPVQNNELSKKPWKAYSKAIKLNAPEDITWVDVRQMGQLYKYADFIILIQNQRPLTY